MKRKQMKLYIKAAVLVLITLIGCYGIIKAPKSDKEILEKELAENELALQQKTLPDESSEPIEKGTPSAADTSGKDISVIGDSVFLGASRSFKKLHKNAVIDAKISRQVWQGLDVAKELNKKGRLGSTVIISLGTNSNFNESTGQELIDYLGKKRTIYWINAYGKTLDIQDEVNRTIRDLADKNKNVHIISWAKKAKKHPDWFYQDGIHLNTEGQEGFARFVSDAITSL